MLTLQGAVIGVAVGQLCRGRSHCLSTLCLSQQHNNLTKSFTNVNNSLGAFWLLQSINSMVLLLWGHEVLCVLGLQVVLGRFVGAPRVTQRAGGAAAQCWSCFLGTTRKPLRKVSPLSALVCLTDDLFCIYSELWPRIWGFVKWQCELQQSLGCSDWPQKPSYIGLVGIFWYSPQCVTNIGITLFKPRLSDALQRKALFHLNKKPTNRIGTMHLPSNPGVFCKPVNICWCIRYDLL